MNEGCLTGGLRVPLGCQHSKVTAHKALPSGRALRTTRERRRSAARKDIGKEKSPLPPKDKKPSPVRAEPRPAVWPTAALRARLHRGPPSHSSPRPRAPPRMREGDRGPAPVKPPPRLAPRGPPGSGARWQSRHPAAVPAAGRSERARPRVRERPTHQGGRSGELGAGEHLGGRAASPGPRSGVSAERAKGWAGRDGGDGGGCPGRRSPSAAAAPRGRRAERGCAQARRDRRREPGCSAAEEEETAPRSLYADAIGGGGGREPRHAPSVATPPPVATPILSHAHARTPALRSPRSLGNGTARFVVAYCILAGVFCHPPADTVPFHIAHFSVSSHNQAAVSSVLYVFCYDSHSGMLCKNMHKLLGLSSIDTTIKHLLIVALKV